MKNDSDILHYTCILSLVGAVDAGGAFSLVSWKNTLVMTMSPVLNVWHWASLSCEVPLMDGVIPDGEFIFSAIEWSGEPNTGGEGVGCEWQWQWQHAEEFREEIPVGDTEEGWEDPWVAAERIASRRSIFSSLSMDPLLSTCSTMAILWVKEGDESPPPPPDPTEPPEPTLLRLGNSLSSLHSSSSSSSSSLLSSSSFLSGEPSLWIERVEKYNCERI